MKRVFSSLLKAFAYTLLFVGVQLVVSFGMMLVFGMEMGIEAGMSGTMPDLAAIETALAEKLLEKTGILTLISGILTLLLLWPVFAAQKKSYFNEIFLYPLEQGAVWPLTGLGISAALTVTLLLSLLPIPEDVMLEYAEAAASLGTPTFLDAVSTVLIAPIAEEVVFRGLVYTRLRRGMPVWAACLLSSLIFALLHGQILWIAYAFVLGVIFATVMERTGTVWSTIIMHVAFNLVGGYLIEYLPASIVLLVIAMVTLAACWKWLGRVYRSR
ncbi:MAG: CPBP family intramembrane metalloprotease [Clostridiales bacterium]|nr:CPBP family intramembrane metalloprotease [Clostridiales bacterium]